MKTKSGLTSKKTVAMIEGSIITPSMTDVQSHYDPNVAKLVTVFFMSHRILAKIYETDTIQTFYDRVSTFSYFHFLTYCLIYFSFV